MLPHGPCREQKTEVKKKVVQFFVDRIMQVYLRIIMDWPGSLMLMVSDFNLAYLASLNQCIST